MTIPAQSVLETQESPPPTSTSASAVAFEWAAKFGAQSYRDGQTLDACGCDSLQLLDFVLRLERATGQRLPMAAFHLDLSPHEIVSLLDALPRAAPALAYEVFFIPPVGGDRPELASFRAACEPALAMQIVPIPGGSPGEPVLRLADVIGRLADRVVARAGPGSIALVGYSRGGRLAALTALALIERGREIAFLALLDTDGTTDARAIDPRTRPNRGMRDAYWAAERAWRRRRWRGLGGWSAEWLARASAWGIMRLPAGPSQAASRIAAPVFAGPARLRFSIDTAAHRLDRLLAAWHAETPEAPGQLTMPVILLRASTQDRPRSPDLGWAVRCADLTVITVPGDHESMLGEHGPEAAHALLGAVSGLHSHA